MKTEEEESFDRPMTQIFLEVVPGRFIQNNARPVSLLSCEQTRKPDLFIFFPLCRSLVHTFSYQIVLVFVSQEGQLEKIQRSTGKQEKWKCLGLSSLEREFWRRKG